MTVKEGVVRAYQHHNNNVVGIVHVSCDTDFVARNAEFLEFVDNLAMQVAYECPSLPEEFLASPLLVDGSLKVFEYISKQNSYFGENIQLVRFDRWDKAWAPEKSEAPRPALQRHCCDLWNRGHRSGCSGEKKSDAHIENTE